MGKTNSSGTVLAAVSVIGLSVGMAPALAEDNANNGVLIGLSKQQKADSQQLKLDSQQHKLNSLQYKQNSTQLKYESNQGKLNSQQLKLDSVQHKHDLNPQPEPPG